MKKLLTITALLLTSTLAQAGGYQLQEYSTTNMGRAFAGAGVVGDDYSAIAFNPAGMDLKNDGLQLGASWIYLRSIFTGTLNDRDGNVIGQGQSEIRTNKIIPQFFGQKRINDRWTLGAGFYVPFGMGTYYKNKDWFGASHAINTEITSMDLAVATSYKLFDNLVVGANVFAEYLEARLTSTGSDMNAHDNTAPGYSLGVMYKPFEDTRFGIAYRSKVSHKISGPHYLRGFYGMDGTKLVLPEHVLLSAYHKVGKFGLSAMARWTRWTRFNKLNIKSDAYNQYLLNISHGHLSSYNTPTVDEDWKNVWMIGAGVDYYYCKNLTFRAGVAHDEGAVKRPRTRTARVPDSNRWLGTIGVSYQKGNWQLDMAYGHMFWKTARTTNTVGQGATATTLNGKYHSGLDLAGVSLQYNF